MYEYAREATWFKDAVLLWRTRFFGSEPVPDAGSLLDYPVNLGLLLKRALLTLPGELERVGELGARGLAGGGALVLGAFPATPWQNLQPEEKRLLARFMQAGTDRVFSEAYRQLFLLGSSPLLGGCEDEAALESLLNDHLNIYAFQIDPEATRNQVELAFKNWLRDTDRFPDRSADARTTTEKSTPQSRLKQLAIKRLRHHGASFTQALVIRTASDRCRTPGWLPERSSDWHFFPERAKAHCDKLFPPGSAS